MSVTLVLILGIYAILISLLITGDENRTAGRA